MELTGKYAQLRDDLKKALAEGKQAEMLTPHDGGASNFDACAVKLPRWSADKVRQAAQEAGTRCWVWSLSGGFKRFVFEPVTAGQGDFRSNNAVAMVRSLQAAGYDSLDYSQMD